MYLDLDHSLYLTAGYRWGGVLGFIRPCYAVDAMDCMVMSKTLVPRHPKIAAYWMFIPQLL